MHGQYAFAPNSASVDAKYKSLLGTNVTTTISNSEVITAGRFSGGNFWFMATDKAGSNINYTSALGGEGLNVRFNYNDYHNAWTAANDELSSPFTLDLVTGNSALDYTFSDVEDYQSVSSWNWSLL